MSSALIEPPDHEPEALVTNHSPAAYKPSVPEDVRVSLLEIHAYYGKEWLRRSERGRNPLPNADWELNLQMREIAHMRSIEDTELIQ